MTRSHPPGPTLRAPGAEVAAARSTATPAWAARRSTPLLVAEHLVKEYPLPRRLLRRGGVVQAVAGVSFHVNPGETLGLVGESGCGKTTTARMVLRLEDPTVGSVWFAGTEMTRLRGRALLDYRKDVQVVFQDPDASLSPRLTVAQAVAEPLAIHRSYVFPEGRIDGRPGSGRARHRRARVEHLLGLVGLDPALGGRYPHELSGGQRQRVGIARALALAPRLVVLDEPVSALDPSVQSGVVNLLADLQRQLGVAYLLIAHDLAVVRHLAHRIAVMYLGRIVETGTRADIFDRPAHPYTRALLSAVPLPDPTLERGRHRIVLRGEPPSPADPPSGCRFRTRCWKATGVCATEEPTLTDRGQGHPVACHFPEDASA